MLTVRISWQLQDQSLIGLLMCLHIISSLGLVGCPSVPCWMNWIPKLDTPSKMPMIGASGGVVRIGMVWVQSDKRRTVRIFKSMGFRIVSWRYLGYGCNSCAVVHRYSAPEYLVTTCASSR